jgi:hypothetical protein
VSADFTPLNIAPTTNQVFSNPFTLTHTTHSSYTVTTKDGYQIVNRKSEEVVMKRVSIEKMYALKQSIPNILYKDIMKDKDDAATQ